MIVHVVWVGEITDLARRRLDRLSAACDGHDLRIHTDETLVPPLWMEAYNRICVLPQMKSDLIRLAALRAHGGMYFDVDVTLIASVDAIASHMPDTYCAVHINPGQFIGGDILHCPDTWAGWAAVDEYVERATSSTQRPSFVEFTHLLTGFLLQRRLAHVLSDSELWPMRAADLSPKSLVCRGFDCDGVDRSGVSLLQKAANFATAAAKHVAAGMPQVSEEEVASRFAICHDCEHYDGKACRQCGCPVVRERQYLSKLSWADSSCPVGKWGPVTG